MALTSVITCHPVSSLEIRDFSTNKVGEDPDPFVVIVLLEDLLIPDKEITFYRQAGVAEGLARSLSASVANSKAI